MLLTIFTQKLTSPFVMQSNLNKASPSCPLTFCLAEDRPAEEVGLRLGLLSIREHCPDAKVFMFRPDPGEPFSKWLRDFPNVTLIPRRPADADTWNCKPQALLELLDIGLNEVIWLDSDIMLTRSCASLFEHLDSPVLLTAEESPAGSHQGTEIRTKGWNLPVGRRFSNTINSCVLRVTNHHRPLLICWRQMLLDPKYQAAQAMGLSERPIHFHSDQDALNALLGSTDWSEIPVQFLKHGRDILHVGTARGYSIGERMAGLGRAMPQFVHSCGPKPWITLNPANKLTGRFWIIQRLILEASPYVALAKKYKSKLDGDTAWLEYSTPLGRLLRLLGFGHYALRGMPLTLFATLAFLFRRQPRHSRTSS